MWGRTVGTIGVAGDARITITACTNPAEPIDEDCITNSRVVTLAAK